MVQSDWLSDRTLSISVQEVVYEMATFLWFFQSFGGTI